MMAETCCLDEHRLSNKTMDLVCASGEHETNSPTPFPRLLDRTAELLLRWAPSS
jgi:hypothetical protein